MPPIGFVSQTESPVDLDKLASFCKTAKASPAAPHWVRFAKSTSALCFEIWLCFFRAAETSEYTLLFCVIEQLNNIIDIFNQRLQFGIVTAAATQIGRHLAIVLDGSRGSERSALHAMLAGQRRHWLRRIQITVKTLYQVGRNISTSRGRFRGKFRLTGTLHNNLEPGGISRSGIDNCRGIRAADNSRRRALRLQIECPINGPLCALLSPMLIRLGYDIELEVFQPITIVGVLNVHPSRTADLLEPDQVKVSPTMPVEEYIDTFGNRCTRLFAQPGTVRLSNSTLIQHSGQPDPVDWNAPRIPVQQLPPENAAVSAGQPLLRGG